MSALDTAGLALRCDPMRERTKVSDPETHLRSARTYGITSRKNRTNMNFKLATATIGAALVLVGSPAFASTAEAQSPPIQIEHLQLTGGTFANADGNTTSLPGSA